MEESLLEGDASIDALVRKLGASNKKTKEYIKMLKDNDMTANLLTDPRELVQIGFSLGHAKRLVALAAPVATATIDAPVAHQMDRSGWSGPQQRLMAPVLAAETKHYDVCTITYIWGPTPWSCGPCVEFIGGMIAMLVPVCPLQVALSVAKEANLASYDIGLGGVLSDEEFRAMQQQLACDDDMDAFRYTETHPAFAYTHCCTGVHSRIQQFASRCQSDITEKMTRNLQALNAKANSDNQAGVKFSTLLDLTSHIADLSSRQPSRGINQQALVSGPHRFNASGGGSVLLTLKVKLQVRTSVATNGAVGQQYTFREQK